MFIFKQNREPSRLRSRHAHQSRLLMSLALEGLNCDVPVVEMFSKQRPNYQPLAFDMLQQLWPGNTGWVPHPWQNLPFRTTKTGHIRPPSKQTSPKQRHFWTLTLSNPPSSRPKHPPSNPPSKHLKHPRLSGPMPLLMGIAAARYAPAGGC